MIPNVVGDVINRYFLLSLKKKNCGWRKILELLLSSSKRLLVKVVDPQITVQIQVYEKTKYIKPLFFREIFHLSDGNVYKNAILPFVLFCFWLITHIFIPSCTRTGSKIFFLFNISLTLIETFTLIVHLPKISRPYNTHTYTYLRPRQLFLFLIRI